MVQLAVPASHSDNTPAGQKAAVESAGHRMQVDLGGVRLEVVTEARRARATLTLTDGTWQVRIVDAD